MFTNWKAVFAIGIIIAIALVADHFINKTVKQYRNDQEKIIYQLVNQQTEIETFKNALAILNKTAIKKNDYNAQTCLTITPDGSKYIPLIVKDENTKKAMAERGELEDWNKRTMYLDLSPLYRKIEKDK